MKGCLIVFAALIAVSLFVSNWPESLAVLLLLIVGLVALSVVGIGMKKVVSDGWNAVVKRHPSLGLSKPNAPEDRDSKHSILRAIPFSPNRGVPRRHVRATNLRKFLPQLIDRQNGICGICSHPLPPFTTGRKNQFHVDHIVPISKGGSNDLSNLQAAHEYCNLRKGQRLG